MSKVIKYKQLVGGRWRYWGYVDGYFVSPITSNEPKPVNCEFTGVCDKDGIGIYDGDIVEYFCDLTGEVSNHKVKYFAQDCYPAFDLTPSISDDMNGFSAIEHQEIGAIKVIGNVYQNPELLK